MDKYVRTLRWAIFCIAAAFGVLGGLRAQAQPTRRAPPATAERDGLILLKNGGVLHGDVTKAGDYYLLTKGDDSELRLPVADVELACRDLEAAYTYKRDSLKAGSVREHLMLAQWCLRHDLTARAADQLLAAWAIEPNNPAIASLENRLARAAVSQGTTSGEPAKAPTSEGANTLASFTSNAEIDEALQSLPPRAVERFTTEIQPLLQNRCGDASCHGRASTSAFQLDRPTGRGGMTRRLTQRNLFAALKQVDRRYPENSPLLTAASTAHGGASEPAIGHLDSRAAEQLSSWLKEMAQGEEATLPTTIRRRELTLPTARKRTSSPIVSVSSEAAFDEKPEAATAVFEQPIADDSSETRDAFRPRDEFDPEIFNRRFGNR